MNNEDVMNALQRWARDEAQIDPHPQVFRCRYYDECNHSVGEKLWRERGCQMSYVSRRYGSSPDAFRLVLVGMDHGDPGGDDFEGWRDSLGQWYQVEGHNFNWDYYGVVKTAAAVFGDTGQHCMQECITRRRCQKSCGPATNQCVLDRIVRANLVKCTPEDQVGRTARATPTMRANCARHLMQELRLLKPNVVVFHGKNSRKVMLHEFAKCGLERRAVGGIAWNGDPILYELPALGAHVFFLHHAAYGRLDIQWDPVVKPGIEYMRKNGIVPA